ncbi:MAG: plasmid pRiA4b ORF-3 family protein [Chloroflexi bacterium]|nr:plasmid pRiA4b ORF-3 family protein [Chloroflexota bacterium]
MPTKKTDDSLIYQLKVTLKGSKPPIWRRIQVRGSTTLAKCHMILQIVMGWTDSHLHQFDVGGVYYGTPDSDWGEDIKNERRVKLEQIVSAVKDRFVYEYDFGDSWEHQIVVEKILAPEPGVHYPICLTGKRACPPEDVGGIWSYPEFLEAIRNPEHPEHEEMLEWIGDGFDPQAFDPEAVNRVLKR